MEITVAKNGRYWQARWIDDDGKRRGKALGRIDKVSHAQARRIARKIEAARANQPTSKVLTVRLDGCACPKLADHCTDYRRHKTALTDASQKSLAKTGQYLVEFFGNNVELHHITSKGARDWRTWMTTQPGRKPGTTMTDASVCVHVRNAKAYMRQAVEDGLVPANPFARLDGRPAAPAKTWRHVSEAEILSVMDNCTDGQVRLMLALCRLAGLRKGETMALTWDAVDWQQRRLRVRCRKTERYKDHAERLLPISPTLYPLLLERFEAAAEGEAGPCSTVTARRADTLARRAIKAAGLRVWAKPFHTLRKSCATDWAKQYPQHAVSEWLGHSMQVAQDHYLKVTEQLYDQATGKLTRNLTQNAHEATQETT
ncbi:tyrosine-type recombinase/integrase [Candidatus Woesearchaeota archaeon]|nr:tyrosine-type recombinase/integrase [Candidatus Woesearchaeota archaeon]